MPPLSAMRTLAIGTLLGPQKERQVDWYLHPGHVTTLLSRLTPMLDKFAQVILSFAFTPIFSWIHEHVSESSTLYDTEVFKVYRLLEFLASLLEHPCGKSLLLKEGAIDILIKALQRCSNASDSEGKFFAENRSSVKGGICLISWCLPIFKSLALICDSQASLHAVVHDKIQKLSIEDCSLVLKHILKLCQALPVGKELLCCLLAFRELAACSEGRDAYSSISMEIQSSTLEELETERGTEVNGNDHDSDWRRRPPFLYCLRNLMRGLDDKDGLSTYAIDGLSALSSGSLPICLDGRNLNMEGITVLKFLFGLPIDLNGVEHFPHEIFKDICAFIDQLDIKVCEDEQFASSYMRTVLSQVKEMVESLLLVLQKPAHSINVDDVMPKSVSLLSSDVTDALKALMPHLTPSIATRCMIKKDVGSLFSGIRKSDSSPEKSQDFFSLGGLSEKFLWECPNSLPERLSMSALPLKRKMTSMEGPNRRSIDNSGAESTGPNTFARGLGPPSTSSGPTRRDTFRHRKPNTSRPPSMHVDDYVARERNIDGASSASNVINSVQHGGSTGGRPPSIHVDEFMARQRERQVPVSPIAREIAAQARNAPPENDIGPEKVDKSRQLKADLDDDLQEINIVFDGEESEPDDRLPFPQPDDNLQPASLMVEESSPHSIVEETESDANGSTQISIVGTPLRSNVDETTQSDFSSRKSVSRPEMLLSREASVSSEKFFGTNTDKSFLHEQSDETKHAGAVIASNGFDSATVPNLSGFHAPFYNKSSASSGELHGDSRMPPPFYHRDGQPPAINIPLASGSQGLHDQKQLLNQPPLPPFPPPPNVISILSQNAETVQMHPSSYGHSTRDMQPPLPSCYPYQPFDASVSGPSTAQATHVREDRASLHNFSGGLLPPTNSSSFAEPMSDTYNSQLQTDYSSPFNKSSTASLSTPHPRLDPKYSWTSVSSANRLHDVINSSPSGSARPPPPLPPMPPPFSASSMTQASVKSSASQSPGYNQTSLGNSQLPLNSNSSLTDARLGTFATSGGSLTSYSPPQLVPPLLISRPSSLPASLFSSPSIQHQGQSTPSLLQSVSIPQPSIQSAQPHLHLQPLQPPQPPHIPPHLRPPMEASQQQSEHGVPLLQNPIQVQGHPFQMQQQPHLSPIQVYYQPHQQEPLVQSQQPQQVENAHSQSQHQHGDSTSQQQQDLGVSLQHYFASPEAIQSLLIDQEKLCPLLEQHPKLMQMLQERLGQL